MDGENINGRCLIKIEKKRYVTYLRLMFYAHSLGTFNCTSTAVLYMWSRDFLKGNVLYTHQDVEKTRKYGLFYVALVEQHFLTLNSVKLIEE